MRRIGVIGIGFAGGVALVVIAAAAMRWGPAVKVGRRLYDHRRYVDRILAPRAGDAPPVVWLGDSTVAASSYPQLLARSWHERGEERDVRVLALPGLDFFDYYFAMGRVLALQPDLVVLVAHLRMLGKDAGSHTRTDLSSMIPLRELPRAMRLPLYDRGITVPRLLLLRALGLGPVEQGVYFLEGIRSTFQNSPSWEILGPRGPRWDVTTGLRAVGKLRPSALATYDVAVSPRLPIVRMIDATVRMAVRHGVPAIVIGSPIPWPALQERGWYDDAVYARRFAVLREVVEGAGGTFLDLHEALGADEFHDTGGHYNERGVRRLSALIEPVVLQTLHRADAARAVHAVSQEPPPSPR